MAISKELLTKGREISWLRILHHQIKRTPCPSSLRQRSYGGHAISCASHMPPLQIPSDVDPHDRIHEILRGCRKRGSSVSGMKAIHCWLIKGGFCQEMFVANNLIVIYADCRCLECAKQVFDEMPEKNAASWTSLISCCTRLGMPEMALEVFGKMQLEREEPNCFALASAAKACAVQKNMDMGYTLEGWMDEAARLFDLMPKPDVVSWNTMIAGYASRNECQLVLECVFLMHRYDVDLDQFTFPCVLEVCGSFGVVEFGKQIHAYVIRSGYESNFFVATALIDLYSQCNCVNEARKLFISYSTHDYPPLWNSMLACYANSGQIHDLLNLGSQMHNYGLIMDSFTYISILKACIYELNFGLGQQVHGLIVSSGFQFDIALGSLLVYFYAGCGKIRDAWKFFFCLPDPDVVAWTGLISGCVQQGSNAVAISLFRDMVRLDVEMDHFVVSSILKACSALATLGVGKQIHAFAIKVGFDLEAVTQTALVDMYCKSGEIEDGEVLFENLAQRDTVCWTGMITGCARHGRAKEAIHYFQRMVDSGVEPNEVTFASVLSACRHAGLTDEAWVYFRSMREKHGLTPRREHYCCMVDLLSQAGFFGKAERLILQMPFEPDETIWKSLLGACRIHRNLEHGNCAANHLLAITPRDTSVYIMLSNIYASLGMWAESTRCREMVKSIGKNVPGSSWIEVRG
ncbi:pentatricopeptide repeat-containing protein At4g08210-like isoform X2 [Nymphaea colorata]|uniref:pentatricopeptide repeat-containing protein At4g08210-like isoform X2 n=1 Tax=Nymphaea colorata TaxID=210225 RepID=UPI00129D4B06|nr:pentatricopeptide repeat-containing protein At4g08210-like isoform X2 [Nymphaea colorata]